MIAGRIAQRLGRQTALHYRQGLLIALLCVVLGLYAMHPIRSLADVQSLVAQNSEATTTSTESGCADTVMAAISDHSEQLAGEAYDCMAHTTMSRAEFVAQLKKQKPRQPAAYRVASDGDLVFFADGKGTGWIVHLDADGKVSTVE